MHTDERVIDLCPSEDVTCKKADLLPFVRVQTFVFLGFWLWILVIGRAKFFFDPGALWHPVVGRQILAKGQFPHVDSFSFTHAGEPWIASQWLGECGLAVLQWSFGLDGILLAIATALAGFYTWAAHRLMRAGVPWWFAVLLTALAIKASSYHFYARPHLATIVLLGWTTARLCDFEAGRIPLRGLFWLVPVMAVWANIHGGVLGGIGTIGLAVAGWNVTLLRSVANRLALAALVVACGLATLLNPYGLDMWRTWTAVMGSPVVHERIIEHLPITRAPYAWPVLAFAGVYAITLLSVPLRQIRVTWLLPLVWFGLAWSRVRNGPLFATVGIIARPTCCRPYAGRRRFTVGRTAALPLPGKGPSQPGWRAAVIPAVVVLLAGGLQAASVPLPVMGHGWAPLDPKVWPVDLLPALRAYESSRPPGTPIFNDMKFGGFLIAETPGLHVFIDDRCELYGDAGILAYGAAQQQDPSQVDRWANQYGFDRALVVTGSSIDWYLRQSGGWSVVGVTKAATLHEKASGR